MIPDEFMWAIGIFEGEGNINCHGAGRNRAGNRQYLQLKVFMTDRDVLERFHRVVNCGRIGGPFQKPGNRKPIWTWAASGRDAETLLRRLLPELCERRREQALIALSIAVPGEHVDQLRIQIGAA